MAKPNTAFFGDSVGVLLPSYSDSCFFLQPVVRHLSAHARQSERPLQDLNKSTNKYTDRHQSQRVERLCTRRLRVKRDMHAGQCGVGGMESNAVEPPVSIIG